MTPEQIAEVAHEINRAYCAAMGDRSQPSWADAPDWQKASAIAGVKAHLDSGCTLTPEQSHQNWMALKLAEGWVWGPFKDPAKKQHPCIVDYYELPKEQRAKDYIFAAVVRAIAKVDDRVAVGAV